MIERIAKLPDDTKRIYGAPGTVKGLPRLADPEVIRRCGDPERLLEQLVKP